MTSSRKRRSRKREPQLAPDRAHISAISRLESMPMSLYTARSCGPRRVSLGSYETSRGSSNGERTTYDSATTSITNHEILTRAQFVKIREVRAVHRGGLGLAIERDMGERLTDWKGRVDSGRRVLT